MISFFVRPRATAMAVKLLGLKEDKEKKQQRITRQDKGRKQSGERTLREEAGKESWEKEKKEDRGKQRGGE